MVLGLINDHDTLERQNEKLLKIVSTLMRRVEQDTDSSGVAYAQFQRAVMLEEEVRARTRDLEHALDLLNESNAKLAIANRETEAARADLANAIETVQEGFALFNAEEKLVMCNSRFGMHMGDIRGSFKPGLHFRDYVRIVSRSKFLSLPPNETPEQWEARRMERHKDNSVVFNARLTGKRWIQVSEHRTPSGGTVILQTDVTDIVRLERQERERLIDDQARLIRATLEHLKQGVCIFDSFGRLVGWNHRVSELLSVQVKRFQLGSKFATICDHFRGIYTFTDGITVDRIIDWSEARTEREPLSFEMQRGHEVTLAVFMQEMPDKGFVISFTDMTSERAAIRAMAEAKETLEHRVFERTLELEDALTEAERANASKSRFVAAASHDLLQPLSAAKLYLASLENDIKDLDPHRLVLKASSALQSVENILGALLDISKLDSGLANTHISSVDLGIMLRQLGDEMGALAAAKGLGFRMVPTTARVASDATYLQRILQNLVSNAVRYTTSGKVLVGVRNMPNKVRVEVWDTGPGIPEEEQDNIFGEFQRLNATASAADGMGLGLAIVERACALLHHPLQLKSEVGKGTVFSVELPRSKVQALAQFSTGAGQKHAANDFGNLVVLLIENDDELRNAITITMEQWGVDVLTCKGGQEALDLLDEIDMAPDVIVADYQLDDGELGLDALHRLRAHCGAVPACIISANRSKELVQACTESDIPLLYKPIEPAILRDFLQHPSRSSPPKG
ncbi:PAS-domain containing protein [Thalassovita sp.]|uniref:hybrid sensor histidine kinase/response regulator n=1 Tax=Thalassovita sp. TaxID=1979401 RepID=UPI0029DE544D|nr:PAS-domain containing protein [Thalassovita sp.]